MNSTFFITGIGTGVGKTIVAAIVTQALQAHYWKPIQAGDLENSDTHTVKRLVSNNKTVFYPNSFALKSPMSPHAAAKRDGVKLMAGKITRPETENHLVIEGAGGLLVPLNENETIIDIIQPTDKVILVSRNYLGSINHTLLSIEALQKRNLQCFGIIFNGEENKPTEEVILKMSGVNLIGRINEEPYFDHNIIMEYAEIFRKNLLPK